eukprot:TRINITY_DN57940_c0_g1_i1.p1 TRINITY_DN57940_c0_g1~~TRINITY_DN57940_c0_g1_i1.p1  ORF type:complete len:260 (+),score=47.01 TRINITY_DN57940_c0_g1_i1:158-937(+)
MGSWSSRPCSSTPAPLLPAEDPEETSEQLRVRIRQDILAGACELDFRGPRQLGPQGAAVVAELLRCDQGCSSVTSVYLCGNSLGNAGAASVAAALEAGTPLTFLDLRSNGIGDAGAESLAKSLTSCRKLSSLDLWFNPIRTKGASHFVQAMVDGADLTWLRFDAQPAEIDAALARNRGRFVVLMVEDTGENISFMSMGGNEVLTFNAPADDVNLKEVAGQLASAAGVGVGRLRIALPDGRLVQPADVASSVAQLMRSCP